MGVVSSIVAGTIGVAALMAAGGTIYGKGKYDENLASKSAKSKSEDTTREFEAEKERIAGLPEEARQKALEDAKSKRRARNRTGGKTILASQYGGNTDSTTKTLLGQ